MSSWSCHKKIIYISSLLASASQYAIMASFSVFKYEIGETYKIGEALLGIENLM